MEDEDGEIHGAKLTKVNIVLNYRFVNVGCRVDVNLT